ncbi:MAG: hypothetical protein AB8B93_16365, partial [Pseudomonadales bacterium]
LLTLVETQIKYAGYIKRQDDEIARIRRHERLKIPADFDFSAVQGLSNELLQKLTEVQPESLAHAARIPGMTPAALSLLLIFVQKKTRAQQEPKTAAASA